MTRPPITNTGSITSIPARMPMPSEMRPMVGSTMSPGMTQMAPSEKPIDRARGGMASDRPEKMPGPMMARVAPMAMLAATASHSHGARANTVAKPAQANEAPATSRSTLPGFSTMSRDARRAPMNRPTSCTGSAPAAIHDRCSWSRPNWRSYSSAPSAPNPTSDAARNGMA
jgi:hypothetical protein